jgi:hypothetical protein
MTYDDFLFTIEQFYEGEIYVHAIGSYNFKKDLSLEDGNEHSYYLYQSYSDLLEGIEFYDSNTMSMSLPCYSFPYD